MKKIIYILTLLTSVLVFQTLFSEASVEQYTKVYDLWDGIAQERDQEVLNVVYDLGSDKSERIERFTLLEEFVYSYKYTTILTHSQQGDKYKQLERNYIFSQDSLKDISYFNTVKEKPLDFSVPAKWVLSGNYNDDNAYDYIAYIDNNYGKASSEEIQYKQFSSYINDINTQENQEMEMELELYFIVDDRTEAYDAINREIIGTYISNSEESITSYEGLSFPSMDTSFSMIVILLAIMATIILWICQIFKSKKEILIRKMQGQGNFYIFKRMFLKQIMMCVVLYFFVQVLAYILLIGNINRVNDPLLVILIQTYLIYLVFLIVAAVFTYFTICQCKAYANIKKRGDIGIVSYGSLLLKMIFVILVITPFITIFFQSANVIKETYVLNKYEKYMKDHITIYGISTSDYARTETTLLEYFNEYGGIYQDFGKNYENQSMVESGAMIERLAYPYIVVNHKYLEEYAIKTQDNKNLNLDNSKGTTLLVPEKYKGRDISQYCDTQCDTIYIKNGYEFINHNAFTYDNYTMLSKKDPIIQVVDDIENWNSSVLFYKETKEHKEELENFMVEHNLKNSLTLNNTSHAYKIAVDQNKTMLTKVLIILFLYLALTLVFQFQSIYIYYVEHKNEFAINYLLGKNFLQRYASILSLNVLVYSIPFMYGLFMLHMNFVQLALFVLIALPIDIIITFIMIRYLEKHRLVKVLKGEN